jgi:hypothetical protein
MRRLASIGRRMTRADGGEVDVGGMRQNLDSGCRRTLSDPGKRGKPTSPLSSTGVPPRRCD